MYIYIHIQSNIHVFVYGSLIWLFHQGMEIVHVLSQYCCIIFKLSYVGGYKMVTYQVSIVFSLLIILLWRSSSLGAAQLSVISVAQSCTMSWPGQNLKFESFFGGRHVVPFKRLTCSQCSSQACGSARSLSFLLCSMGGASSSKESPADEAIRTVKGVSNFVSYVGGNFFQTRCTRYPGGAIICCYYDGII